MTRRLSSLDSFFAWSTKLGEFEKDVSLTKEAWDLNFS
jgi:hypothetical protein